MSPAFWQYHRNIEINITDNYVSIDGVNSLVVDLDTGTSRKDMWINNK